MTRSTRRSATCAAVLAAAAVPSDLLGASFYYTFVSSPPTPAAIQNDPVLANYGSWLLRVTTFGDWTEASIRMDLTGGTFYNSPLNGNTQPNPAIVSLFPQAGFDTYVTSPTDNGTNGATQVFGGHGGGAATISGSTFSVHWGDAAISGPLTFDIGRFTFPFSANPTFAIDSFIEQTDRSIPVPIGPGGQAGPHPNNWLPDADGSWHDENNWQAGDPLSFHSVNIDVGGSTVRTITHSEGASVVWEMDSDERILLTGGSLGQLLAGFFGGIHVTNGLTLSGGTLLQTDVHGSPVTVGPAGGIASNASFRDGLIMPGGAPLVLGQGFRLGGTAMLSPGAVMRFSGSQTMSVAHLATSGVVLFNGGVVNIDGGSTLTVFDSIAFRGSGGILGARTPSTSGIAQLINHGLVSADVPGGSLTVAPDTFINHGSLQAVAGAVLLVNPNLDARAGTVGGDGVVRASGGMQVNGNVVKNGDGALRVNGLLALSAVNSLDFQDGSVINDYDGPTPFNDIRNKIVSGYNNGSWDGVGIRSSTAAVNEGFAIGYAEASALFTQFPATFAGEEIDETAVLMRYTREGDANLDLVVNLSDYNRLAANFGTMNGALWDDGDFNYDGNVNLADYNLLAGNYGLSASPGGPTPEDWAALTAVVPEPASALSLVVGVFALGVRRRIQPSLAQA